MINEVMAYPNIFLVLVSYIIIYISNLLSLKETSVADLYLTFSTINKTMEKVQVILVN